MVAKFVHGALYSFPFLRKERQTRLGKKGNGWPLPTLCLLLLSVPSNRKTDRARREWDGWPAPTVCILLLSIPSTRKTNRDGREGNGWPLSTLCPLLFSTPSDRKTDRARFERGWWPTPTWAFYRQTDLGLRGMGGQLLHGPSTPVYPF